MRGLRFENSDGFLGAEEGACQVDVDHLLEGFERDFLDGDLGRYNAGVLWFCV